VTKDELLSLIDTARARIDAAIARTPDDRMNEIALYDAWTMKDFIAHLTFWERQVMSVYAILQEGNLPWAGEANVPIDNLNAEVLEGSRTRSLEDVRADAIRIHEAMRAGVAGLSDEALFTPGFFGWLGDQRAFEFWVKVNSYEHYDEHLPDVEVWLTAQSL
jgi:hypothetical protein